MWPFLLLLLGCPPSDDRDGDGLDAALDCDDEDADVGPRRQFYADRDGDGYGGESAWACARPSGYVAAAGDCDDGDPTIHPEATEICDYFDNNCDQAVDEGTQRATWYPDMDGDGYGNPLGAKERCGPGDGEVTDASDCDDTNAAVHPAAIEICNGYDDDCDDLADGEDAVDSELVYEDFDGDGFGDAASVQCGLPSGYSTVPGDCDDADPQAFPGALEVCDGDDEDCDDTELGCVWRGAWSLSDAPGAILGEGVGDLAGSSALVVGDLTGDGVDDLLVSAFLPSIGTGYAAHLFESPTSGAYSLSAAWARFDAAEIPLGLELGAPGDVDGNGTADVVLIAPTDPTDPAQVGVVYLLTNPTGSATMNDATSVIRAESAIGEVVGGGDMDGDGVGDLIVAAPKRDWEPPLQGAVYVETEWASTSSLSDATLIVAPSLSADRIGTAIAFADADGDGLADLILTAGKGPDPSGAVTGAAWVFSGSPSGALTPDDADAWLYGGAVNDQLGSAVTSPGDVDGDGYDELWIAARTAEIGSTTAIGAAYLLSGPLVGEIPVPGVAAGRAHGVGTEGMLALASAGDVDGDGASELLLTEGTTTYLLLDALVGTSLVTDAPVSFTGEMVDALSSGDLDGDGRSDLVVATPLDDTAATDAGAVWILLGSDF